MINHTLLGFAIRILLPGVLAWKPSVTTSNGSGIGLGERVEVV